MMKLRSSQQPTASLISKLQPKVDIKSNKSSKQSPKK